MVKKNTSNGKNMEKHIKIVIKLPLCFCGKKHINWGSFQLAILDSWCRTPKCGTSAPAVAKLVHV